MNTDTNTLTLTGQATELLNTTWTIKNRVERLYETVVGNYPKNLKDDENKAGFTPSVNQVLGGVQTNLSEIVKTLNDFESAVGIQDEYPAVSNTPTKRTTQTASYSTRA